MRPSGEDGMKAFAAGDKNVNQLFLVNHFRFSESSELDITNEKSLLKCIFFREKKANMLFNQSKAKFALQEIIKTNFNFTIRKTKHIICLILIRPRTNQTFFEDL